MTRKTRKLQGALALVFTAGALLVGATSLLGNAGQVAHAQVADDCDSERVRLCIHKETIPSRSAAQFLFQVEIDNKEDVPDILLPTVNPADTESFLLGDGDEAGFYVQYAVRITEAPASGWQLTRIDCDFNEDTWDMTQQGSSVLFVYNPANTDGALSGLIDCTFTNQEVRQPLNLGGLFAGQPTPLPTAPPAAAAPAATAPTISPPRTGDAGLK